MSYPFSINKKATIQIRLGTTDLIKIFKSELNKLEGIKIKVNKNEIDIIECVEFSSRGLRLKNLNRGKITFEKYGETMIIKGKILLLEHLILVAIVLWLGIAGIKNYSEEPMYFGVLTILLFVVFAFCYLMPLITFNSFFNQVIKKVLVKGELNKNKS